MDLEEYYLYEDEFISREGLGKYVSRRDDGSKVRGRRGAKSNLHHNSTLRKHVERVYTYQKDNFKSEILAYNFLV